MLKEELSLYYEIFFFIECELYIYIYILLTHWEDSFCEIEEVAEIINACWYLI